jgi:hypothetical protein
VLIIRRWQLSEPRRLLQYVVGDEITVRMELWHHMDPLSVEVVFEHREDPNITLTLQPFSKRVNLSEKGALSIQSVQQA